MNSLVFLTAIVACCYAAPWSANSIVEKVEPHPIEAVEGEIRSHYHAQPKAEKEEDKVVDNVLDHFLKEKLSHRNVSLSEFNWKSCADGSNVHIKSLSVSDPITIPGQVTVGLDAAIAKEITQISSVDLVIKKKIFGVYIEVPCVDNIGSCTYNNICTMLAPIKCPQQLLDLGFTCHCPFAAKEYKVPAGTEVTIPKINLPSFVENGDYDIKGTVKNGAEVLACYEIQITLKAD